MLLLYLKIYTAIFPDTVNLDILILHVSPRQSCTNLYTAVSSAWHIRLVHFATLPVSCNPVLKDGCTILCARVQNCDEFCCSGVVQMSSGKCADELVFSLAGHDILRLPSTPVHPMLFNSCAQCGYSAAAHGDHWHSSVKMHTTVPFLDRLTIPGQLVWILH